MATATAARGPAAHVARRLLERPATVSPTLAYLNARSSQAVRQKARERQRARVAADVAERRQIREHVDESAANVRAERRARREDWDLGARAPRRHLLDERGPEAHGALTHQQMIPRDVPKALQRDWGIEVGDRVVIVRHGHRDVGKIGKVRQVQLDKQTVTIERIDVTNYEFPPEYLQNEADQTPFRPQERPVPLADVRLVVPLWDAAADGVRDCVIDAVRVVPARNRHGQRLPQRRFIAGTLPPMEIPYAPEREHSEHDGDTLRIEVEERSWTPTLSEPPMPASVINELRNPYSKFRTHHDPAWLAARDAERLATAEGRAKDAARMITPLEERRLAKAAEKEAEAMDLDEVTLERIGRLMAKNMNIDLDGAEGDNIHPRSTESENA